MELGIPSRPIGKGDYEQTSRNPTTKYENSGEVARSKAKQLLYRVGWNIKD